jgi:hypothetical protein
MRAVQNAPPVNFAAKKVPGDFAGGFSFNGCWAAKASARFGPQFAPGVGESKSS